MSPIDLVYIVYRSGPSTEPWGTPKTTGRVLETSFSTQTHWPRSCRYEPNHLRARPEIPKANSRRCRSISWSITSKAADWSNITRATVEPLSRADVISWCTRSVPQAFFGWRESCACFRNNIPFLQPSSYFLWSNGLDNQEHFVLNGLWLIVCHWWAGIFGKKFAILARQSWCAGV